MTGLQNNPLVGATGTALMGRATGYYPDVWDDLASQNMPRTMPDALRWSQSIHMIDATFAQASRRVASYFVTDPEVRPYSSRGGQKLSDEEQQRRLQFLRETLRVRSAAEESAVNLLCFGNVFVSLLVPFVRYLHCPGCGYEAPLEKVGTTPAYAFRWADFQFQATCPGCGYRGAWGHVDRRGDVERGMKFKFWNPHEMEILDDPLRDEQAFVWKIPEYYRKLIREGKLFHLCRANWEVIQAVKRGEHLLFDPGVIFHMRQKPLHGVYAGGWGLSNAMVNFRQAWTCQLLRRYNEAICQEFIVPFRLLSPEAKSGSDPGSGDPVFGGLGGAAFKTAMRQMVRAHRRDPGTIQVSPFPVNYQMLGGDATQLAPYQLIDQAVDALLNGSGFPAELYKGTLSFQALPAALRMFESMWVWLVDELNRLLAWANDRAAEVLAWEPTDARFMKVRHADDANRQMALFQLMMNRNVSQTTALRNVGIDWQAEQDQMLAEEDYVNRKTQELQEVQQARSTQQALAPPVWQQLAQSQGQGPGAAPGGDPSQGGGQGGQGGQGGGQGGPQTPQDVDRAADQIADQLLTMPETQRKQTLLDLKRQDTTLHGLVRSKMDEKRRRQDTQAGAAARGQGPPAKAAAWRPPAGGLAILRLRRPA